MKTGLKVIDVMTNNPVIISPEKTVLETAEFMKKEKVGSLLVGTKNILEGIVTEQDLVYKIIAKKADPKTVLVKEIMTKRVITITPKNDIIQAMKRMSELNVRRLPVVEGDEIIGLVTEKDILKVQPELIEIVIDKIKIREEERKPIKKITENEGICSFCGEYATELYEVDGVPVCKNCS